MPTTALEIEDTDLVTADSQVDDSPVALDHALPRYDNTSVSESADAILVGAKLGHTAGAL